MHILNNILSHISKFVSELCNFQMESFDNLKIKFVGDDSSAVSQSESWSNSLQYYWHSADRNLMAILKRKNMCSMLFGNSDLLTDQELGNLPDCMEQIFRASVRLWFVPAVRSSTVGIPTPMESLTFWSLVSLLPILDKATAASCGDKILWKERYFEWVKGN